MPAPLFFDLHEDKRQKILSAAVAEFAANGYTNASTNTIVKNACISKGSLFQYFSNKEELYFYIVDSVTAEMIGSLEKEAGAFSTELFRRVTQYSALEFSWYLQNPEKARLILSAFTKSDKEIYQKVINRYGDQETVIYGRLLEDVDTSHFRWEKQKTVTVLKWMLKGLQEDFLERIQKKGGPLAHLQQEYLQSLTEYMDILKNGLYC